LCGNVTWNYDPTGANPKAKTIRKDIRRSLAILQAKAGITFTEVADPAKALLTYSWKDFGSSSPAATGGYSWSSNSPATGSVEINTRNYWPTDQYAGERPGRYGPAGRVWLLVHETMHTMGFGHVPDAASVMAPTNRGQAGFTRGDLAGFAALYPRAACR
jgi:hypothetical protein